MKRICFVGASTTEGMGDPSRRGWAGNTAIVKNQTAACYNLGVRGQTIFQIADRAAAECNSRILEYQSGGIVLGCALNEIARLADGTHRASQTAILNCYSVLIAELAEIAPLVIIGPPPVLQTQMPFYSPASGLSLDFRNQDIEAIDTLIHQKCIELGTPYLTVFKRLLENPTYTNGLGANDGLHTDAAGYATMAEIIENSAAWMNFTSQ